MSATTQSNGKKSSNSSAINTPASTPVTNGTSQTISHSTPPPPNNNAPKYGTLVPNRIFVGGISANTTEGELLQLFSTYGTVKAAKIIQDRAGVSKGYGFITFESEDDAKRPLKDSDNIVLRERKLNIAPAIKKQPFNRAFDASSPSAVTPGNTAQYFFPANPYFQGGVTYYPQPPTGPGDPNSQPTTVYQAPPVYPAQTGPPQAPTYPPMMFPPQIYQIPQQYMQPLPQQYDNYYYTNNGGPQYMVGGGQNGPSNSTSSSNQPPAPPMPPSNSPPRPPCFNTLPPPHYPQDPNLYYNLQPIYSGPLDNYPAEAMDMANGGGPSYTEVSTLIGDFVPGYEFTETDFLHPHAITPEQPPPQPLHEPNDIDNSRQTTKTPVVSLLSMEQQQEKDFVSLQSGRRVKLQPPQPVPQPPLAMQPPYAQPPQFYNYNYNPPPIRSHHHMPHYNKTANNTWRSKSRNYNLNRKNNNNDSSSLRTDSNSSASAVDENKNEEKVTPPVVNNFHLHNGSRTYQNSLGRRAKNPKDQTEMKNKTNFGIQPQQVMRNSGPPQYMMNSASLGARRTKRTTTRRSGQSGGGEIGAGDAPLPDNDIAENCKKIESLKI